MDFHCWVIPFHFPLISYSQSHPLRRTLYSPLEVGLLNSQGIWERPARFLGQTHFCAFSYLQTRL